MIRGGEGGGGGGCDGRGGNFREVGGRGVWDGARMRETEPGGHQASMIVKRCKVENGWCKSRTF